MTYIMETLNKGTVELSRDNDNYCFGDYSIPAKDFFASLYKIAKMENNFKVPLSNGKVISIEWNEKEKIFKIGDYEIEGEELEAISKYSFIGGYLGWNPERPKWKPKVVKENLKNIEELVKNNQPIHPCLKEVPKYIQFIDQEREKIIKSFR